MNYFVNLWLKNVKKMKEEREEVRATKKILRLKKVHVDLEQEPLDFLVYVIYVIEEAKVKNVINKDNEIELNRSLLLSYLEELGKEKKDKRFINWAIKEIRLLNDVELASLIGRKVVTEKEYLHLSHKKIRNILHFLQYPSIEDVLNDRELYEELLDKLIRKGYMGILRKNEKKTIYKWKYTNGAFAYFCDVVANASFSEKKEIYPYFKRDIKDKNGRNFKNLPQAKQDYKKKKKESGKDENFKKILNDYLRKKKKKRIEKLLY